MTSHHPRGRPTDEDVARHERAAELMRSQARLRRLVDVNQSLVEQVDLARLLRRLVESAVDLLNARYGALAVTRPDGGLEQFIHVGVDEQVAGRVGHPPRGTGILGSLVDDPGPIRLTDVSADSRSVGFPAGHPPMRGLLGVPIRVGADVYGSLYLTDRLEGDFTAEDQELAQALAATAGLAISNARLLADSRHRERWAAASAQITRELLLDGSDDALDLIAERVLELVDADLVAVVLPGGSDDLLTIHSIVGLHAEEVRELPVTRRGSLVGRALDAGRPLLVDDFNQIDGLTAIPGDRRRLFGAGMALPLVAGRTAGGALSVLRRAGAPAFVDRDLELVGSFAGQAALALERADAQRRLGAMQLLEDRDRIARDLHDHVIQRLFASGLALQGLAAATDARDRAARVSRLIEDLDQTIGQIRTSIFALRGDDGPVARLRTRVLHVLRDVAPVTGSTPSARFEGAVDATIVDDLADDVLAVVREAATNAGRHAQASHVQVLVAVDATHVRVVVEDDGVGLGATERRSGLANLQARAHVRGGRFSLGDATPAGTRLTWTAPIVGTPVIGLFVVDDHELVRRGLIDLLGREDDMTVVGEAATVADAVARIPAARPDVVVVDGRLPDGSGIEVCRFLQDADPPVRSLILTSYDDDEALFAAVLAGAAGYLLKEIGGSRLVESIRLVHDGRSLLDPVVTERVMRRVREPHHADPVLTSLTTREREILLLVADGLSNRQIGQSLFVAEKTVKNYVSSILAKLGMERRTQAAVWADRARDDLGRTD
ncbi:GAF domain-containing protein [Solicola sp. PLA-1-18]|uniref:GAF domain-containing protein n=1 Tax=Solicola sp. PLA-1-18 TaxID=3380532 RepID=UPI003B82BA59